jgi:hypothetical protein
MNISTLRGGIKAVTRYDSGGALPTGTGTTTVTITAVADVNKTSLNLLSVLGDNQANQTFGLSLTNSTTVTIHYSLADGAGEIHFEVIEYN